jgi:D-ribose pyranose/furanose isomerase RbsD
VVDSMAELLERATEHMHMLAVKLAMEVAKEKPELARLVDKAFDNTDLNFGIRITNFTTFPSAAYLVELKN